MNVTDLASFDASGFTAVGRAWTGAAEAVSASARAATAVGGTMGGWHGPAASAATSMVGDVARVGGPATEILDSGAQALAVFVTAVTTAQTTLKTALAQAAGGGFTVDPDGTVHPPPAPPPAPPGPDAGTRNKLAEMDRQDAFAAAGQLETTIKGALTAAATADQRAAVELADIADAATQAQGLAAKGGDPSRLEIDLALSHVGDARQNAALQSALQTLLKDPKSIRAGDITTLAGALSRLSPAERGAVIDALAGSAPMKNLGQALHEEHPLSTWDSWFGGGDPPLGHTDFLRLSSLLLADAAPATVHTLMGEIPGLDPSLAGVSMWASQKTPTGWQAIDGPVLNPNGSVSATDPHQTEVGDCYFISSLIATAKADPTFVANHIHDNGNGTTTVTLYQDGHPVPVTVANTIPSSNGPDATYSSGGYWPDLYEKAYAHLRGGYGVIDQGGYGGPGLSAITGQPTTTVGTSTSATSWIPLVGGAPHPPDVSATKLGSLLGSGHAVVVGTNDTGNSNDVTGGDLHGTLIHNHEYVVDKVNANGTVTLRNPWDPTDKPTMPWSKIQSQASEVVWTNAKP